ncbi:MAG: DNA polymerase III subunit gamma/tau [Ilumatobacteraceae bacterium]
MATQSLYRRYRPRRFSEVKGQEHVVRALRNAVVNGREGQAYLFSGPRGTGKTTSARILAKVLNCERPVDGEPCCECASCLAVEQGTSYDVHELDAASNNGVDAMRDLIEKASLGTPGRHKVYILDEVHMLSRAAEAALLKTLEEPPPHVVFVLATTDPQKVSETIRSRTQHLQFHLLPMDVLEEHIRWLAGDAGIPIDDAALQSVLRQGGGSARDTVSALEVVAASGGDVEEQVPLDEFVEAMVEHDPGRALALVAAAVQQGREARLLADDIVRHLRDCFLSLMAPELVQLPARRQEEIAALASQLGPAAIVRAMERLGQMLVEMRYAPDPRLLLEVALVQLTHEALQSDPSVILARLERVEHALQSGGGGRGGGDGGTAGVATVVPEPPPVDPSTGRARLGGRIRRDPTGPMPRPVPATPSPSPAAEAPRSEGGVGVGTRSTDDGGDARPSTPAADHPALASPSSVAAVDRRAAASEGPPAAAEAAGAGAAPSRPPSTAAADAAVATAIARWSEVLPTLRRGLARPLFSALKVVGERDGKLVLGAPNEPHRSRSAAYVGEVEAALAELVGVKVPIVVVVDGSADDSDGFTDGPSPSGGSSTVVALRGGDRPSPEQPPADEDVDLSELTDVPPESVVTPVERLLQAFPGSQELDER